MFYEVSYLWTWLILALIVGGVVGWRNESDGPQQPWFEGWLETAVLFFAAYVIGCFAGGAARRTGVAG
jgi:hypothetical protein